MLTKGTPPQHEPGGNILLIQLGDIGDVVLTIPAIRALHDRFPKCRIIVAVRAKAKGALTDCPYVDRVLSVDAEKPGMVHAALHFQRLWSELRRQKIAWTIELRTGDRGTWLALISGATVRVGRYSPDGRWWRERVFTHVVNPPPRIEINEYMVENNLNILRPLGVDTAFRNPVMPVSAENADHARAMVQSAGAAAGAPIVAIHPFSLWRYKEWRNDQWALVIDQLRTVYNCEVIITGSPDERSRVDDLMSYCKTNALNMAGKTRVDQLPALFSVCRLVIGVDTAAIHIAAAAGTATLAIFGPTPPIRWAPRGPKHKVVTHSMACIPCCNTGCESSGVSRCIDELTAETVLEALDPQMGLVLQTDE